MSEFSDEEPADEEASDDEISDQDVSDEATSDDEAGSEPVPGATARAVCEYLVKAVVEEPDRVQVSVHSRGRRTAFDVRVEPGDMGRVIGKRGRIAQAIRTVVRAAAVRDGVEVDVEFVE
ncbi:MAG: KH domain-containing protein [Acidimicrobiia bacterium]